MLAHNERLWNVVFVPEWLEDAGLRSQMNRVLMAAPPIVRSFRCLRLEVARFAEIH
jgi:hypothetical protein